jgi:cell division protein FtsI/penicillin-binding protein 2
MLIITLEGFFMHKRITILGCAVMFIFFLLIVKIYTIAMNPEYYSTAVEQGSYTLKVGHTYGNIYDRNFNLLVNDTTAYYVAVNPTPEAMESYCHILRTKMNIMHKWFMENRLYVR